MKGSVRLQYEHESGLYKNVVIVHLLLVQCGYQVLKFLSDSEQMAAVYINVIFTHEEPAASYRRCCYPIPQLVGGGFSLTFRIVKLRYICIEPKALSDDDRYRLWGLPFTRNNWTSDNFGKNWKLESVFMRVISIFAIWRREHFEDIKQVPWKTLLIKRIFPWERVRHHPMSATPIFKLISWKRTTKHWICLENKTYWNYHPQHFIDLYRPKSGSLEEASHEIYSIGTVHSGI